MSYLSFAICQSRGVRVLSLRRETIWTPAMEDGRSPGAEVSTTKETKNTKEGTAAGAYSGL